MSIMKNHIRRFNRAGAAPTRANSVMTFCASGKSQKATATWALRSRIRSRLQVAIVTMIALATARRHPTTLTVMICNSRSKSWTKARWSIERTTDITLEAPLKTPRVAMQQTPCQASFTRSESSITRLRGGATWSGVWSVQGAAAPAYPQSEAREAASTVVAPASLSKAFTVWMMRWVLSRCRVRLSITLAAVWVNLNRLRV